MRVHVSAHSFFYAVSLVAGIAIAAAPPESTKESLGTEKAIVKDASSKPASKNQKPGPPKGPKIGEQPGPPPSASPKPPNKGPNAPAPRNSPAPVPLPNASPGPIPGPSPGIPNGPQPCPGIAGKPCNGGALSPPPATPAPPAPQAQQQPAPPSPQQQQAYQDYKNKYGKGDGNGNFGGSYDGNGTYSGAKCKLPNLDYSKFPKDWGKAMVDRLTGKGSVRTESGAVLNGSLDLTRTGRALAQDIGCPSIDPNDHDKAAYMVAAVMIAISCPESGWNPKDKFDERKAGGIRGARGAEANESRGLLQMTKASDNDPRNGCVLRSQADLDGPITNLMCGLAKIKKRGYTRLSSFGEYWSVVRKMGGSIRTAVKNECNNDFAGIRGFSGESVGGASRSSGGSQILD